MTRPHWRNELAAALVLLILCHLVVLTWMSGAVQRDLHRQATRAPADVEQDAPEGLPVEAIMYGVVVSAQTPPPPDPLPPLSSFQALRLLAALPMFRAALGGDDSQLPAIEALVNEDFSDVELSGFRRAWAGRLLAPDDPRRLYERFDAAVRRVALLEPDPDAVPGKP